MQVPQWAQRGAPRPQARGLLRRHRGELRVPLLLVLQPGRQHGVRDQALRDALHQPSLRG